MAGSPESIFKGPASHGLDRFHMHARQCRGVAADNLRRREVNTRASFNT
jgi:hypothetical protein